MYYHNFQLQPLRSKALQLGGELGKLLDNIVTRWLLDIRETNPAILDMFSDADYLPHRHVLPWSGEFAGKYLTCSTMIYQLTGDERLKKYLEGFVAELISLQKPNGYIGPFSHEYELTGKCAPMQYAFDSSSKPESYPVWDCWGHYHIMLGLLLWHDATGDQAAFSCVERIAQLHIETFFGEGKMRIVETGSEEMNLSVVHTFAMLYRKTGKTEYLRFAEEVVKDLEVPPAGDYLRQALQGVEFYQMPKPRWESLHPIQGLMELYAVTNDEKYRKAVEHIWWSITSTDVHNTGGFSTQEQALGSPYRRGPIETCCVIAYMALSADMLRLTGNSVIADMLELSTFNSSMGSFNPSGRWSTYDTPMEGYKRANYHQIGFQCRPGSPDLNCCSVNAPRAFGLLNDWAYMTDGESVIINYYGSQTIRAELNGEAFVLTQHTEYPYTGTISFSTEQAPAQGITLKLRIPFWSETTHLKIGEKKVRLNSGSYADVHVKAGDTFVLDLDMALQAWAGEARMEGKASLFRGPLVLCADAFYDRSLNVLDLPTLDLKTLRLTSIDQAPRAGRLFHLQDCNRAITVCNLYTAGSSGSPYSTWFPTEALAPKPFSKENPFRLQKIGEAR